MADSTSTSGGIGFVGLLTVLFVALKLTDVIDWSWWWVLSPVLFIAALLAALLAVCGVVWAWPK